MEYRKRRRKNSPSEYGANPAYYAAAALFLVIAGLIGFSRPSTWVAERVLAPVFSGEGLTRLSLDGDGEDEAGAQEASTPVGAATETRTYILSAYDCYALQIGVYEDEANARTQAEKLMQLGAAGRVEADGGRYRVLASAYPTQADAKAVQQRLQTEGMESYVYPVRSVERTYSISGDAAQTQTFYDALSDIPDVLSELYAAVIAFDRDGQDASAGRMAARAVQTTCDTHADALARLPADAEGQVASLATFYRSLSGAAADVASETGETTAAMSSRLKGLYLHAVYEREALSGE